ncbi:hypothetical protein RN347_14990 [Halomonas sp. PAMB 3264]|uniref:hypothetical protein n=1 Tax=unclassified Halomonas TaxID=2609666 RepID=UPI002899EE4F|nr:MULTISPECIES: hypothetical protein [unclassified Halomonas]WNL38569.1 hypothetical protein RN346_14905 [Halomonas sp. PAMB 3232]WNL41915.1 hypothetical protein RN347_14990 [Halomonas sp. PAMB 3264]
MPTVALVAFSTGHYRYALEASQVRRLTLHADVERVIRAAALLGLPDNDAPPDRWLTLSDAQGVWQLGVGGSVELIEWPASALYPLPALVKARALAPLCGVAMQGARAELWLLDAERLTGPTAPATDT